MMQPCSSNRRMQTDLRAAVHSGNLQACQDLIAAGVDVNGLLKDGGSTALMEAAGCGHAALVQALLAAGANVNAENSYGRTALTEAAGRVDADVVQILLEAGAGVHATDALRAAVQTCTISNPAQPRPEYPNGPAVVSMLVAAGADVNNDTVSNLPAFTMACHFGESDMVRPMLQYSNDECLKRGLFQAEYRQSSSLTTLLLHEIASRDLAADLVAPLEGIWDRSTFFKDSLMDAWLEATAHTDAQLAAVTEQQQDLAAVASSIPHLVISLEAQGRAGHPTSTRTEADKELAGRLAVS